MRVADSTLKRAKAEIAERVRELEAEGFEVECEQLGPVAKIVIHGADDSVESILDPLNIGETLLATVEEPRRFQEPAALCTWINGRARDVRLLHDDPSISVGAPELSWYDAWTLELRFDIDGEVMICLLDTLHAIPAASEALQ